jgi:hypothetical protein
VRERWGRGWGIAHSYWRMAYGFESRRGPIAISCQLSVGEKGVVSFELWVLGFGRGRRGGTGRGTIKIKITKSGFIF